MPEEAEHARELERRRRRVPRRALQRPFPGEPNAVLLGTHGLHRQLLDGTTRGGEEEAVAGCERSGRGEAVGAGCEHGVRRALRERVDSGRPRQHAQAVERGRGDDRLERLEGLRQLVLPGHALHAQPHGDRETLPAVDREGEPRDRGRARPERVADQAREARDRLPLGRRPQVGLVRVALLVEGQHVGDGCPELEQRDGVVVARARGERRELRRPRDRFQHRLPELRVRADPVAERAQRGPIRVRERRRRSLWLAAAAHTHSAGAAHPLPPSTETRSTPRSAKFGSFSSCAISQGPTLSTPLASSPEPGFP